MLYAHVVAVVARMPARVTFDALLAELQLDARNGASPIIHASRSFSTLTYNDPTRGSVEITFGRLRNIFTEAKRAH